MSWSPRSGSSWRIAFFIPSTPISEALRVAALAGIEVELMFALRDTGSPLPNWAANTYYADMAQAGASIYLYRSAYLHTKTLSVDESVCCVGTANMDIRSFAINYEMTALIYDEGIAGALEEGFELDLEDCIPFDLDAYRRRPAYLRLRDSLARLCSPLL